MKVQIADGGVFTVAGVLTPDECRALIARGTTRGSASGRRRCGLPPGRDTAPASATTTGRSSPTRPWRRTCGGASGCPVPPRLGGGHAVGLDDWFRFYRYDVGQRFNRHKDGRAERAPGLYSRLTCLVYLNGDFAGGEMRLSTPTNWRPASAPRSPA